jgi:hypothetical protein
LGGFLQDADHRRGRTELAADRLSVPIVAALIEGGGALILVSAERARDFLQSDIDHPTICGAFADCRSTASRIWA